MKSSKPPEKRQRLGEQEWRQLRDRLARAAAAADDSQRVSPERARALLAERARLLARVPPEAPPAAKVVEVLAFVLGNERYAVDTAHVREVLRPRTITPLPGAPEHLLGITNVRGQVLACFDLRRFLGVAAQETPETARIIVLGGDRPELGLLVDSAQEVARLRTDEILEAPPSLADTARAYVRGVTAQALILLDGAKLLMDPRLIIDLSDDGLREDKA